MKHFDNYLKNSNIPQLKPEAYNTLMEMLVDLSETNFEKLEVNFPIGKVVFMPYNINEERTEMLIPQDCCPLINKERKNEK